MELAISKWVVDILYLICAIFYILFFVKQRLKIKAVLPAILGISIISHFYYLVFLSKSLGRLPLGNVFEVLTTCMWLFALTYFFLELKISNKSLGTIIIPIIVILQTVSNVFINTSKELAPVLPHLTFEIHVITMLLAYSGFAISFIASLTYVLLSTEIQHRRLGFFFSRLPSLQLLDRLSNLAVSVGLVFASAGIIIGFYMGSKVWESFWQWDPKFLSVFVTWIIYAVHFFTRNLSGWQGKRAAYVSIIGFNWVLFSFLIVSIFFTKIHSF